MSGKRLDPALWAAADWTLSDSALGRELGVSRPAVFSQRRARGKPAPDPVPRPTPELPRMLATDDIHAAAGKRIRIARLGLGWTLERLGCEAGSASGGAAWGKGAVWYVEHGEAGRRLTLDSLGAFARALGLTPADLLRRDETGFLARPQQSPGYVAAPASDLRGVVGDNVRRWRLSRGMSPTEMAAAVNRPGSWNATCILRVEQGVSGPEGRGLTLTWLERFAAALGVPASNLVRLPSQSRMEDA